MSARRTKPFYINDPKFPGPFHRIASTNTKKIKPLWQSVRLITFYLSVGGGFPLWNVGKKKSRWNLGQFILTIWLIFVLSMYCWWAKNTVDVLYQNAFRIVQTSTVSFNMNVSVVSLVGLRTVFAAVSNWWHRKSLARIFSAIEDLQEKLQLEMHFFMRLCGFTLFTVLAGIGVSGLRIVVYMGEVGFLKYYVPLTGFLTFVDVVCGRSPILLFVIFAEAFIGIARAIRLRFNRLVTQSKGWIKGNQNTKEIDELRILHGQLCSVIEECSSCFSSSLAVGLLVDMFSIIAIFYGAFMDIIPACEYYPTSLYCVVLPFLAIYCLAISSFIIVLCVEGERLYTNVSRVTNILKVIPSIENEYIEKAVSAFSAQVLSSETAANINRCFDIRLSLLPAVIGTVVTYLIIVIQFRQTDMASPRLQNVTNSVNSTN